MSNSDETNSNLNGTYLSGLTGYYAIINPSGSLYVSTTSPSSSIYGTNSAKYFGATGYATSIFTSSNKAFSPIKTTSTATATSTLSTLDASVTAVNEAISIAKSVAVNQYNLQIQTISQITSSGFSTTFGLTGNNYSDYLYWKPNSTNGFAVETTGKIHLGSNAGYTGQGYYAVALGYFAGYSGQGNNGISIGPNAGIINQGYYSVALGAGAGKYSQSGNSIAIGLNAGSSGQYNNTIAIGAGAGNFNQGLEAISIGDGSGYFKQGNYSIAMGYGAGQYGQSGYSIAIGANAGYSGQNNNSVAIGYKAGQYGQSGYSIAIGSNAGYSGQNNNSVAIGYNTGQYGQSGYSVAIGNLSGQTNQGAYSIAIGNQAGVTSQPSQSIIFNASSTALNPGSSGFYVNPIGPTGTVSSTVLTYDPDSNRVSYYNGTGKTFVIDHPTDINKYLVHACLEGPEAGVYYRGKGEIINNDYVKIFLPNYVSHFTTDFDVYVTQINNGKHVLLRVSEVENNSFIVYGENTKFSWIVYATRINIDTEPNKKDVTVNGNGPYLWI